MRFFSRGYVRSLRAELKRICAAEAVPLVVQLELTYRCNLRCSPCHRQGGAEARRNSDLTLDEIDHLLSELSESGTLYLLMSGGEVMSRADFWEIALHAKEKGFLVVLSTNGTLIGSEEAERMRELSPSEVEICLVGMSPEFHDRATGVTGSFDRAMRGVEALRDKGVCVSVRTVGCDGEAPPKDGSLRGLNMPCGRETSQASPRKSKVGSSPQGQSRELPDSPEILSPRQADDKRGLAARHGMPREVLHSGDGACVAGKALATISPWGEVRPCTALEVNAGNVRDQSFRDIWRSLRQMGAADESPLSPRERTCRLGETSLSPCLTSPCRLLR
jgi:MoaA/NifB/PqqE/SkfB family radical SAM enzyme